jgi:hypothetical protein
MSVPFASSSAVDPSVSPVPVRFVNAAWSIRALSAATTYTANAAFRSGDQIGAGNYVIFNGSGTSVLVTALSPGATYHVQVYEYNGGGEQTNYRWEDPASGSRDESSQRLIWYTIHVALRCFISLQFAG